MKAMSRYEAAKKDWRKYAFPIIKSLRLTVAAFIPLRLMPGNYG